MSTNIVLERLKIRISDPEAARSTGTFGGFKAFPPTTEVAIQEAEQELNFQLPPLLKGIYKEVANGGIGPGYGIIGLSGGAPYLNHGGNRLDLVQTYYHFRGEGEFPELNHDFTTEEDLFLNDEWYDKLLPLCPWGDDHFSLLNCSAPKTPVIHWVAYGGHLIGESPSFESWLNDWLNDVDLWKRVMG